MRDPSYESGIGDDVMELLERTLDDVLAVRSVERRIVRSAGHEHIEEVHASMIALRRRGRPQTKGVRRRSAPTLDKRLARPVPVPALPEPTPPAKSTPEGAAADDGPVLQAQLPQARAIPQSLWISDGTSRVTGVPLGQSVSSVLPASAPMRRYAPLLPDFSYGRDLAASATYAARPTYSQPPASAYAPRMAEPSRYERPPASYRGPVSPAPSTYHFAVAPAVREAETVDEAYAAGKRRIKATIAFDVSVQALDEDEAVDAQYSGKVSRAMPEKDYGVGEGMYAATLAAKGGAPELSYAQHGAPQYARQSGAVQYSMPPPNTRAPDLSSPCSPAMDLPAYVAARTAGHLAHAIQTMCTYVLGSYGR